MYLLCANTNSCLAIMVRHAFVVYCGRVITALVPFVTITVLHGCFCVFQNIKNMARFFPNLRWSRFTLLRWLRQYSCRQRVDLKHRAMLSVSNCVVFNRFQLINQLNSKQNKNRRSLIIIWNFQIMMSERKFCEVLSSLKTRLTNLKSIAQKCFSIFCDRNSI